MREEKKREKQLISLKYLRILFDKRKKEIISLQEWSDSLLNGQITKEFHVLLIYIYIFMYMDVVLQ